MEHHPHNDGCRHGSGKRRGDGCPRHSHFYPINQDCIPHKVKQVHGNGDQHGCPGIAHGPEQSRTSVVHSKRTDGNCGYHKIDGRIFHDLRLYLSKNPPQYGFMQSQKDHCYRQRQPYGKKYQLPCGPAGIPGILLP